MNGLVENTSWIWPGALSEEFCNTALKQIDWATSKIATTRVDGVIDPKIRRSDIVWQHFMQPLGCIAKTYIDAANQAAGWEYALSNQEHTQIVRYKSADEGHYDWHMDVNTPKDGIQRKLSCVILLNDSSEFEGGVLQFKGMEDTVLLEKRGSIIVFPSFIEHKVTPVTKGVRYSAVTWATGPSFR